MTARERLGQLGRAQNSRMFKVVASIVVIALHLAALTAYVVAVGKQNIGGAPITAPESGTPTPDTPEPRAGAVAGKDAAAEPVTVIQESTAMVRAIASARADPTRFAVGLAVSMLFWLAIVWLGLTLTYLSVVTAGALVVAPLLAAPATGSLGLLGAGVLLLTLAFTVLIRAAEVAVSPRGPTLAIARNVLSEAVRMKVSLVFIVLLILGLAALPGWLDSGADASPLRYRVQVFLQYGTGGAFWMISLLTLAFSASTVSFDQRDKTIWQTMTKPVASWQYVLGKWLGVVTLNAVLLSVCGAAVFEFTEYLRSRPAQGEREAYDVRGGTLTEDRFLLETQVLTARVAVDCEPPEINEEEFEKNVQARIDEERRANSYFQPTRSDVDKIREGLRKSVEQSYRSLAPRAHERYVFIGLAEARDRKLPITFRWRVNSGSNAPDQIYRLSFSFSNDTPVVQACGLGYFHSLQLYPSVVDEDGVVTLDVWNGDITTGQENPNSIAFPPGGLEISYVAGGFRTNFVRVMAVLWIKLAFLAMVAIWASTFLSFPVACLVAFGTFFCAESASFLAEALETYQSVDDQNKIIWYAVVIRAVAVGVSGLFKVYSDLRPTARLVEGTLLPWRSVAVGVAAIAASTLVLYGAAVATLRRRELAVYSGH